jgi:hypothetical protein
MLRQALGTNVVMENLRQRVMRPVVVVLTLFVVGCGQQQSSSGVSSEDYSSLRAMSDMYSSYRREHQGKTPPDEQAFRDYLATKQEQLGRLGLTVDKVFESPRNGAPLQWVYGKEPPKDRSSMMTYLAYEKTPVDGKRLVFGPRGVYELMDDTRFKSVFPGAP